MKKIERDMALLNELESQFPVEDWQVDGVHVWPLIRIPLSFSLNSQGSDATRFNPASGATIARPAKKMLSIVAEAAGQARACVVDAKHNVCAVAADVLIISSTKDRLLKLPSGEYFDIHCDPIIDSVKKQGRRVLVLEIAPQNHYLLPRYSNTRFVQNQLNWLRLKAEVEYRFARQAPRDIAMDGYQEFADSLAERGIAPPSVHQLAKSVAIMNKAANYFVGLLTTKSVRLAMVCDYCSGAGLALNLACIRIGIPSVDIQHGVSGELHGAYGRWTKVPPQGYEVLPTVFWCWSEDEAMAINAWNTTVQSHHGAVVGGNSWSELWLDETNSIVAHYDNLLAKGLQGDSCEVRLLVTLQTGGLIPPVLLQVIKHSPASWLWHIRFHPYMTLDERNQIKQELNRECPEANVELAMSNSLPLMALLRNIDVLLTEWSATIIDAKTLYVPSVAVHPYAEEYFGKEIEQGWVKTAYTSETILAAIREQLAAGKNFRSRKPVKSKTSDALRILFDRAGI